MFTPLPAPFRFFQLPEDKTFRRSFWILCALVFFDCSVLVFQKPIRAWLNPVPRKAPPSAPAPPLMVQPRLEGPNVRAPWQQMLQESRAAAAKGQTAQALRILADVEPQLPQLPFAVAELAAQFEKLGATDRAMKLWERVYQYGASAGVYFSAAEAKLRLLHEHTSDGSEETMRPATDRTKPLGNAPSPQANAPVRFGKFSLRDAPDSNAGRRHFILSVPILKTGPDPLEAKDLDIEIQFYDQIQGKVVERTNGYLQWKWVTDAMQWKNQATTHVLEVEYHQGPSRKNGENRTYFGYVAGIYLKDKLQDYRSDPPRLGQQYPPPRTLHKESSP
jgi:hypothetical protein